MNAAHSLRRKWFYLAALVLLLFPLSQLSRPSSVAHSVDPTDESAAAAPADARRSSASGGWLSQVRQKEQLANDQLLNIDPTSETMKLAALGLRPLAVTILWQQSHEYKKREDWSNLLATSKLILRLQPSFLEVWRHVSWNIAYNVSVEWDDYRDRYHWVMEGIRLDQRGVRENRNDPSLLWWLGWMVSHKIGKSDEADLFRKLFVKDDDFHGERKLRERDNWLVGKSYYRLAESVVDQGLNLRPFKGTAMIIFHSSPPLNNFYYALALAKDGIYDEVCREAWRRAFQEWAGNDPSYKPTPFGERRQKLSLSPWETGTRFDTIQLNYQEKYEAEAKRLWADLEKLRPGAKQQLEEAKRAALSDAERKAMAKPYAERTPDEANLAAVAASKLTVSADEVAEAAPPELRPQAKQLAKEIQYAVQEADWINRYRGIVNFEYWRVRADSEQTDDAAQARRLQAEGKKAAADADFRLAHDRFSAALEHHRLLVDAFPDLLKESLSAEELFTVLKEYRGVLQQTEEDFPLGYGFVSVKEVRDWDALLGALRKASIDAKGGGDKGTEAKAAEGSQALAALVAARLGDGARDAVAKGLAGDALPLSAKLEVLDAVNRVIQSPDLATGPLAASPEGAAKWSERAKKILALPADERTAHDLRVVQRELVDRLWADLLKPAKFEFVLADLVETHATMADLNEIKLPTREGQHGVDAPPGFKPEGAKGSGAAPAGSAAPAGTGTSANTGSVASTGTAAAATTAPPASPKDGEPTPPASKEDPEKKPTPPDVKEPVEKEPEAKGAVVKEAEKGDSDPKPAAPSEEAAPPK